MHVPDYAAQRPRYKGHLVPFTALWRGDIPDFKVVDPEMVYACVNERLCGICGNKIGPRGVFIGGSESIKTLLFTDPAMHAACAAYAYSACPFLSGKITEMSTNHANDVVVNIYVSPQRPAAFYTLSTTDWRFTRHKGELFILAKSGHVGEIK